MLRTIISSAVSCARLRSGGEPPSESGRARAPDRQISNQEASAKMNSGESDLALLTSIKNCWVVYIGII